MGIIYQLDKRTGITYAYENHSFWDKEQQKRRATRKLIGRVNTETGEITPTDGRCRKMSETSVLPKTVKECREMILNLQKENEDLKAEIEKLRSGN
jgi:hypothetical protein